MNDQCWKDSILNSSRWYVWSFAMFLFISIIQTSPDYNKELYEHLLIDIWAREGYRFMRFYTKERIYFVRQHWDLSYCKMISRLIYTYNQHCCFGNPINSSVSTSKLWLLEQWGSASACVCLGHCCWDDFSALCHCHQKEKLRKVVSLSTSTDSIFPF